MMFRSTGAGPRGDRSKVIETDHGEVQSKYRYMGFGLWENTDPTKPKKRKKIRPPPPPPKVNRHAIQLNNFFHLVYACK